MIPADLEINDTPKRVFSTCDVNRGDTVSFRYMAGDNPGKTRTVLVLDKDRNHVKGVCLERNGEFRNFLWNRMDNLRVVPPFVKKIVNVTYEPVSLADYMQALMAK